jgi:hypothetical protein
MIVRDLGSENSDEVGDVIAGSPVAQAGIAPGTRLVAVNGRRWTPEILREAIRRAKGGSEPIELLVENEEYFHSYRIDSHGGERYPHLERNGNPDLLSEIARMKAPPVSAAKDWSTNKRFVGTGRGIHEAGEPAKCRRECVAVVLVCGRTRARGGKTSDRF